MTQFPIMPPPSVPQKRDCIVVDGHVYCREEIHTPREAGFLLLAILILCLWGFGGAALVVLLDEKLHVSPVWPYVVAWYVVPTVTLILFLIFS